MHGYAFVIAGQAQNSHHFDYSLWTRLLFVQTAPAEQTVGMGDATMAPDIVPLIALRYLKWVLRPGKRGSASFASRLFSKEYLPLSA